MTTTTEPATPSVCSFCAVRFASIEPPAAPNPIDEPTLGHFDLCSICFHRRDAIFMSLLTPDNDEDNRRLRRQIRENWRDAQDRVVLEGDD